ncbi:MAG: hypothetical protein M1828_001211 [Chrysothrix sp. TS-e1954]|nr:MAG: hypothetical protein M1828_001211 [Chrysothrix sp. TS-e1954]
MTTKHFRVIEHTINGQHIREYPNATRRHQEDALKLAIKQYQPLEDAKSLTTQNSDTAVTIIAGHGIGFPKEAYEPLWDDLWEASQGHGFRIKNIWFADLSNHGQSGVLNEEVQGDDPAYLSLIHPRLLTSLILIEPVIMPMASSANQPSKKVNPAMMATLRPDLWPSRAEAEAVFRGSKVFKRWDQRALDKYLEYSLREIPTALYPTGSAPKGAVTLTTSKAQEAWSYVRANFETVGDPRVDRMLSPDLGLALMSTMATRIECTQMYAMLPLLRPSVYWMVGAKSMFAPPEWNQHRLSQTGTGVGGSGGQKEGKVEMTVFEKASHFLPMEETKMCATRAADWLGKAVKQFKDDEEWYRQYGTKKSDRDMLVVSKAWRDMVKKPADILRPAKNKL